MRKTNTKAILIIAVVLIVAAVGAVSTYFIMRRNVSNGADGIGINSISPYGKDKNGANVYKVTLSDGTFYTFLAPQGQKGQNGADGTDGETPYIGDNGDWFIGDVDTGVKAEGKDGKDGESPTPLYAHFMKIGYVYATFVTPRATAYAINDFETLYNDLGSVNNTDRIALSVSGCVIKSDYSSKLLLSEECYIYHNTESYYAEVRCRIIDFVSDGSGNIIVGENSSFHSDINSNSLEDKSVYPLFVPGEE